MTSEALLGNWEEIQQDENKILLSTAEYDRRLSILMLKSPEKYSHYFQKA